MKKIIFICLSISLVFVTNSCFTDNFEPILGPENKLEDTDVYHNLSLGIDSDKIVGNVTFLSVFDQAIYAEEFEDLDTTFNYIMIDAEPNWQMTTSNKKIDKIVLNGKELTPRTSESNIIREYGSPYKDDDIEFYYGNELNSIEIAPTDFFNGVDTSISIGNRIEFKNVTNRDTIHSDSDFTFKWNENTGKYVEIVFRPIEFYQELDYNGTVITYDERFFIENFGEHTFSQSALEKLHKGEYLLSVTSYDRKFLYDDIGRIFMATIKSGNSQRIILLD